VIYQATEQFVALLERAGLTQTEIAGQSHINRYHLAHVAAGRRHVGGTYATRIAMVYAARMELPLEEALTSLFTAVRERKSEGVRHRDAAGRFMRATSSPMSVGDDVRAGELPRITDTDTHIR
jgi:hypothetical protein